jgi:hypothetical protein
LEDFKIGGQVIHIVKYVDDFMLLSTEETVLQDTTDRLHGIGRWCGRKISVKKNQGNENLKGTIPSTDYTRTKNN